MPMLSVVICQVQREHPQRRQALHTRHTRDVDDIWSAGAVAAQR